MSSKMAVNWVTFVVLCVLVAVNGHQELDPMSDEFIDLINSKQNFWTAGRNFPENTPFSYIQNLLGVMEDKYFHDLEKVDHLDDVETRDNLPESFDPREKWPNCPSLSEIRDQGSCGSCWALGAVEAMTDRYCTYSNGQQNFHFSAHDLLACCNGCGIGCGGAPCDHTRGNGPLPPCGEEVKTPPCDKTCESGYGTEYTKDKRFAKRVFSIDSNEESIKVELYKNGPIEVTFEVYRDFVHYKKGVYVHTDGARAGRHAVKLLGWGVENGVKYWLIANSWNPGWGDNGYFKILRGENHCGIEGQAVAGEPLFV
ncbi:hypothetical protein HF086_004039 [Spodoptera exigua]|uniref:Peptidase C1A papain C-terminal domain-containing protein n=1 Tax=Spodoptera exigua TaxID=7107 RepID=A0A922MAD8_SPOEX|nr:hypothetical protein HF086_004039 [Spodoptera exigua]